MGCLCSGDVFVWCGVLCFCPKVCVALRLFLFGGMLCPAVLFCLCGLLFVAFCVCSLAVLFFGCMFVLCWS